MNVAIYILECVIICVVFGTLVLSTSLKNPVSWVYDYPPEIQERYYETQGKKAEKQKITVLAIVKKTIALIICFGLFTWMAHMAGGDTFVEVLLMVYGYMFLLFAFDTFFIDWVLFPNIKKFRLPGTEDMDKEYHQKWFHVKACLPLVPVFVAAGIAMAGIAVFIW